MMANMANMPAQGEEQASPPGTIFQYFILVMAISPHFTFSATGRGSPFGAQTLEEDRGGSEWDE